MPGNCIQGMGIHYAYDIKKPGDQTWDANTLFPLQPMYNSESGKIVAILFTNPWFFFFFFFVLILALERVYPLGDWEGPFLNFLYCKNWCADTGCHWDNTLTWSTMHWLFTDPENQQCKDAPCKL